LHAEGDEVTQVIRVLPLWYDATPLAAQTAAPRLLGHQESARRPTAPTDDEVRAIALPAIGTGQRLVASVRRGYAEMVMRGDTHAHVR
jgi:hypothetical protein